MSTAIRPDVMRLERKIVALVAEALAPYGFHDARRTFHRRRSPWAADLITLPLDVAEEGRRVFVTANVSLQCPALENVRDEFPAVALGSAHFSTFTRNLGQLLPGQKWRQWEVVDDDLAPRVVRALAATIVEVALPWCEQFQTLAQIRNGFATFGHRDHQTHTLPLLDRWLAEHDPADPVPASNATLSPATLWAGDD